MRRGSGSGGRPSSGAGLRHGGTQRARHTYHIRASGAAAARRSGTAYTKIMKGACEMGIDWKRKLSSRKLWIAVAGFVSGLILAFGGAESTAATASGCILQGASVLGYLLAEGLTDAEGTKNTAAERKE